MIAAPHPDEAAYVEDVYGAVVQLDAQGAVPGPAALVGPVDAVASAALQVDLEGLKRLGFQAAFDLLGLLADLAGFQAAQVLQQGDQAAGLRVSETGGQKGFVGFRGARGF
jgi:hypothetical protein